MMWGMLKDLLGEVFSTRRRTQQSSASQGRPTGSPGEMSAEEAACRRALELMPNFAEAHNNLGVVLRNARRLTEAEAAFRRAINLHGDNVAARYNLGVVLTETNRLVEAEAAYRSVLNLQPDHIEGHNNLGVVLMDSTRLGEAEAEFRRALELRPDFAEARKNLGIVAAKSQRLAEVEAACRHRLELNPHLAQAHNDLGIVLKDTHRLADAEAAFRQAIDLDGKDAIARYNLGVVLAETNRPWEAESAYRSALDLKPDFVEAFHNLGVVLTALGRLAEAEATFRSVLRLEPNYVEAHASLGAVLRDTRRLVEAETAFRNAVRLNPAHAAARRNLEFVGKELQRLSTTEAACRRALELKPNCVTSHYRLGLTQMALEKWDEAITSFGQVLAIEPDHAKAHHNLGAAFARQGRLAEAVACYHRAISLRPDFAKAMANLGAVYFAQREVQQATTWNQAALAIEPHQVDANQNMAGILLDAGQRDKARQHLERVSAGQSVYVEYATDPKRMVLLLWTKKKGNVPTVEFLFPANINTRVNWVIESGHGDQSDDLPDYDLVFNAMGDPDLIGDSLAPLSRFTQSCTKPLLNPPDKVARTARNNLPALLDGIDNIVVPAVWRFASSALWDESVVEQLPLLIRPVDSHGGAGLELTRTAAELARCRAAQRGPVYVSRFVDFHSADSFFRKYRIIFIDRKPYPYHLAIAPNWLVHYFTAGMEPHAWKLDEEKAFLRDPESALGSAGMRAMHAIGARMDLEYSGIDFSLTPDKRILVFEANPTMIVHPEPIGGPLEHKNEYVFRIQADFEELLRRFSSG